MDQKLSHYFECVKDPRVVGRCDHLLSDLLIVALCTYITGGTDYQDIFDKRFGMLKKENQEKKTSLRFAKIWTSIRR